MRSCRHAPALPDSAAIAPTHTTPLDQLTAPLEAEHPGQSAFRLVVEGTEAFVSRVQSARMAARSIDVQSYIWHMDLTGSYFVQELLLAADRGVRVRMLLDDMDARNENATFAALAAHPNIEVRIFNPFASRQGALRFIAEATDELRAHQSAHAQQELDRRQPDCDRRRAEPRR